MTYLVLFSEACCMWLYLRSWCAIPTINVKLSLIGSFESASANGHRAYIEVWSWQKSQFHKITNIWHRNLLDITTDVNSITKVKESRFHVPIYHIFWELQFAELPECIAIGKINCRDWTRFPDPLWRHPLWVKSVVRAIPSSTETPECLPDIHERPPNLAESNDLLCCLFPAYA
jgi:hypothetical protein